MDLFRPGPRDPGEPTTATSDSAPLADRMRPRSLDEILGQEELIGPGRPLKTAIEQDRLHSMILWGPPGSGKTTLARLIAQITQVQFLSHSAVLSGIKEIREVMRSAAVYRRATGRRTVLFIDEIHRFNRAQQDAFLPHVEQGSIVLIGATTENPSFEVNAALLSRCTVYLLRPLTEEAIVLLLKRAMGDVRGVASRRLRASDDDLLHLASISGGDARRALNVLELLAETTTADAAGDRPIDRQAIDRAMQRAPLLYDKSGEEHYNLISALHKSLRNSDPDAALYWLTRMIESGEDPLYLARRMVRFASEDIGNADPRALHVALSAKDAFDFLGMPEGALALLQAAAYLAAAPKSNATYVAHGRILEDLRSGLVDPVPTVIRNAPTGLMKDLGYGKEYLYAHDFDEGTTDMECLPDRLRGRRYYEPRPAGFEKDILERLKSLQEMRRRMRARREGGLDPVS